MSRAPLCPACAALRRPVGRPGIVIATEELERVRALREQGWSIARITAAGVAGTLKGAPVKVTDTVLRRALDA